MTIILILCALLVGLGAGTLFAASIKREINAAESSIGAKLYGLHDRLTAIEAKIGKKKS